MANECAVKLSANFERNLADLEQFLIRAEAPQAFDALLDELLKTVIPNLERFPGMGRRFLSRVSGSVEGMNALASLRLKLASVLADQDALREYIMDSYLLLYVQIGDNVHLLAIKHHKQLSFDFEAHWGARSSMQ
ncbi:MAG: type II toxin-antitoxin system RelE/ParE family toxin [Gammaproteobacteria bacterium]|uniref:type II toxin-antitoxin system RelE/ParE family toxin n=1 Tax=Rhodoferax sp. TaxID=50421 RepID=UPI00181BBADA|nr:type II toxin-antitoxin system RelE/ParE family toxin [Rhodoferax sp.]MBU3900380.1 type II toxin-antitoxin system RelE/ParE family toxin [Gammaproteobacteria bacterium]MBA3058433.1 type II toxin-antitoxin system RelE/ParE family toxin [Rhodoferax sp.]MBU3999319.1 type II toxin-antitoxin system RelE/ParE family toxin [Gammaproteobacteria bacterium]MBU4018966.1 type II toxin-antitoxin system RelE/ParE family toxin [Gammaproteobacteria bacterium]MBU4080957.1 type II toxin-antitoxin system RelE